MVPSPLPIAVLATIGAALALMAPLLLPCGMLGAGLIAVISLLTALRSWRLLAGAARHRHELVRTRRLRMTTEQFLSTVPRGQLYLGVGVWWQRRHAQALHALTAEDRDAIPQQAGAHGDNRIMGVAWRDCAPLAIAEEDANVHILIYGASKRGKSLFAENLVLQAIAREGSPVIVIDPKGDPGMRERLHAAARLAQVPFHCLDFAEPASSATYNPLSGCDDPDQVGDRIAELCDHGEGAGYWRGRAAGTARVVARAFDAVRRYLEACGGLSALAPPDSRARELGRGHAELPGEFAPLGWLPRLSVLDLYGVDAVHRLLAWMLRVAYAHLFAGDPSEPERLDREQALAWWEEYARCPGHPDEAHATRAGPLAEVRRQLLRIRTLMDHEHDELSKANSSLFEALERFRGRVAIITDTAAPQIVWDQVAASRAVVYFSLAAQEYGDLAAGFARILCADLVSWCGRRTRARQGSPWYLLADEVDRWIPSCFTDFLARGRSAGLRCIAIGQTRASFAIRLGQHGRQIIEGNVATVVQFAAKGAEDALAAARLCGTVQLLQQDVGVSTSTGTSAPAGRGPLDRRADGYQAGQTIGARLIATEAFPAWAVQNLPTGIALLVTQQGPALVAIPELTPAAAEAPLTPGRCGRSQRAPRR